MIQDAKIPEAAAALGIPVSRLQRAVIDPQTSEERIRGVCEVHGVVRDGRNRQRHFDARRAVAGRGPHVPWLLTIPDADREPEGGAAAVLTTQQARELHAAVVALETALRRVLPLLVDVSRRVEPLMGGPDAV